MKESNEETNVMFRYWKDDVIAIFPEIPGDSSPHNCLSYQHIGQHGTCDPAYIIRDSKPATVQQYQGLKTELESMGYALHVVSRQSAQAFEVRKKALASS